MPGKRATLFAAVLILYGAPVAADEAAKYVCIADAATGFKYENGNWSSVDLKIDDERFFVAKKKHWFEDEFLYSIKRFGEEFPDFYCEKDAPNKSGYIHCEDGIGSFRINIKSSRYMKVYPIGYIDGQDNNTDTPMIEIGTCTKL